MALLKGGEGRSVEDVEHNGTSFGLCVLVAVVFLFSAIACHRPWSSRVDEMRKDAQVPYQSEGIRP